MTTTSTNADAFKLALVAGIKSIVSDSVLVTYGHPGLETADDMIGVTSVTSQQAPATLGPRRQRDETLTIDVIVSCYRGGGVEAEMQAGAAAYALLGQIEQWCRVTDTTVGGTVWQCFLTSHRADGATDPAHISEGRVIEIVATFTAKARISS